MGHIKIIVKKEKELETIIQTLRIYNYDIDKCAIREKREKVERIELTNQENIRTLKEKENYKNLEILERTRSNKQR